MIFGCGWNDGMKLTLSSQPHPKNSIQFMISFTIQIRVHVKVIDRLTIEGPNSLSSSSSPLG